MLASFFFGMSSVKQKMPGTNVTRPAQAKLQPPQRQICHERQAIRERPGEVTGAGSPCLFCGCAAWTLKATGEGITSLLDGKGRSAEDTPVLQRLWLSHKNSHTDRLTLGVYVLQVHE